MLCGCCALQAITEEVGDDQFGKQKERQLVQVVTPENPQYLYNFAEKSSEVDVEAPAICGEHKCMDSRGRWGLPAAQCCAPPPPLCRASGL